LPVINNLITFAAKMKDAIEKILASEYLSEELMIRLIREINEDDEPLDKKSRQLLLAYLEHPEIDEALISLCGWSMKSLVEMVVNEN